MHIGTKVILNAGGIKIDSSSMEMLGVVDNSSCWGGWFSATADEVGRTTIASSHLFLTPYPPELWPCLLRLEVRMLHRPGVFAKVVDIIASEGLNIVATQSVQGGHEHAVCTFILDANHKFYKRIQNIKELLPREGRDLHHSAQISENEEVVGFAHAVTEYCVKLCELLEARLGKVCSADLRVKSGNSQRIDATPRESNGNLWDAHFTIESIPDESKACYSEIYPDYIIARSKSTPAPTSCSWLQFYFYAWIFADQYDSVPIFKYDRQKTTLVCTPPYSPMSLFKTLPLDDLQLLISGLATIDRRSNSARFIFDHSLGSRANAAIETCISYSASIRSLCIQEECSDMPSSGVLSAISSNLAKYQIVSISNSISKLICCEDRSYWREDGDIVIRLLDQSHAVGSTISSSDSQKMKTVEKIIENAIKTMNGVNQRKIDIEITSKLLRPWRMFVSTHANWYSSEDNKDTREEIEKAASSYGYTVVFVDFESLDVAHQIETDVSRTNRLEDRVKHDLSDCDCMLQILPREFLAESMDTNRLRWMFYERGFAGAREMTLAVCMDIDELHKITRSKWEDELKINAGEYTYSFNSRNGSKKIGESVKLAIESIYNRMVSERGPSD